MKPTSKTDLKKFVYAIKIKKPVARKPFSAIAKADPDGGWKR